MRVPQMKNVLRKVGTRLAWYLKEVVPLFVLGSVILLWFGCARLAAGPGALVLRR